ncbi:MAG: ketoacid-CoA transferase [Desulfobacteraceae bacterium]|nr:ketoacid-CoA transferase [Desulfobacteraceae bacterium]
MNKAQSYTPREIMTIMAAREIKNGDIVFSGTGISMLAAMAAKNINAPDSVIFFETGAMDSLLEELPFAVADPRIMYLAAANSRLTDAFATMQNKITGEKVIAILGAAQIDSYGNLNTTCIGDYHSPKIRFSGSGGGCDVASFVPRCIAFMQHEKRKFVKKLDYLTSPGQLRGKNSRQAVGLRPGGVSVVVTNLGVMRFDKDTGKMYLDKFYPGITHKKILENTEFDMDVSKATQAAPPTKTELKSLRQECDPQRLILG